jgi:acyl dehydratase
MPRPVKFSMVVDRNTDAGSALPPPSHGVHFPKPMLIGATLVFWTIVLVGLKLILT